MQRSGMDVQTNRNRVEQTTRRLEAGLLDGSWMPGSRLPAERVLAEQLAVSRSTVREAIQRLAARGLLASRRGSGVFVTDRLQTGFVSPWRQLIGDHPEIRGDMLEFRRVLEASTAELAAQRATATDRKRLAEIAARLKTAHRDGDHRREAEADADFHEAIAAASHNTMFRHLHAGVIKMLREHIALNIDQMLIYSDTVSSSLLEQHLAISAAIRRGDAAAARDGMYGHIEFVRLCLKQEEAKRTAEFKSKKRSARRRVGE
jgi:GntR family transcriptional repressor for pyruvate dehydrogenase complex